MGRRWLLDGRRKQELSGLSSTLDERCFFLARDTSTVAAFVLSPIKDGLQQWRVACGGMTCTGTIRWCEHV